MNWFRKLFGERIDAQQDGVTPISEEINSKMAKIRQAGSVNGQHYTDSVEVVKDLKRKGKYQEAEAILLESVTSTEKESQFAGEGWGVAPWYYEQLAIIYRKQQKYDKEVEILERYATQPKAPGVGPQKLSQRLEKAKILLARQRGITNT